MVSDNAMKWERWASDHENGYDNYDACVDASKYASIFRAIRSALLGCSSQCRGSAKRVQCAPSLHLHNPIAGCSCGSGSTAANRDCFSAAVSPHEMRSAGVRSCALQRIPSWRNLPDLVYVFPGRETGARSCTASARALFVRLRAR